MPPICFMRSSWIIFLTFTYATDMFFQLNVTSLCALHVCHPCAPKVYISSLQFPTDAAQNDLSWLYLFFTFNAMSQLPVMAWIYSILLIVTYLITQALMQHFCQANRRLEPCKRACSPDMEALADDTVSPGFAEESPNHWISLTKNEILYKTSYQLLLCTAAFRYATTLSGTVSSYERAFWADWWWHKDI